MNMVKMTGQLLLTAALGLSQFACNQSNVQPDQTAPAPTIQAMRASMSSLAGDWMLTNYKNDPLTPSLQNRATLSFQNLAGDEMQIGGRSFINHYGGKFEVDEQKGLIVSTDDIISTLMGGSEADMNAESKYLDRLPKAKFFELTGTNQLTLYVGSKDNPTEVMYFTRK
ncbi:META domain-containing protein [Spirosoma sp. BT702]|uniref:META domain-containing protein n=1 Tax=Spirosoma profusum TaxID=2771354 RepID=A0A926Y3R0_9BACT|nr:META domain-containing protein [Spirosoma profusum]MBD2702170.1 META domain-containing protein [Spirosoma profusum]